MLDELLDDIVFDKKTYSENNLHPDPGFGRKGAFKLFKKKYVESFCSKHDYMKNFLNGKVFEESNGFVSKTYLIMDNSLKSLYAFFTIRLDALRLDSFTKTERESILLKTKRRSAGLITTIPYYLIEEVSKNEYIENNPFHMPQIMSSILNVIVELQRQTGGRLVILNSINEPKVLKLYENELFVRFGNVFSATDDSDAEYQPMFRMMQ